jgi:hypothetical protein
MALKLTDEFNIEIYVFGNTIERYVFGMIFAFYLIGV